MLAQLCMLPMKSDAARYVALQPAAQTFLSCGRAELLPAHESGREATACYPDSQYGVAGAGFNDIAEDEPPAPEHLMLLVQIDPSAADPSALHTECASLGKFLQVRISH